MLPADLRSTSRPPTGPSARVLDVFTPSRPLLALPLAPKFHALPVRRCASPVRCSSSPRLPSQSCGDIPSRAIKETTMVAIGHVTKQQDGSYKGELKTLTIRTALEIRPVKKTNDRQPDFRVYAANNVEIGTARRKIGQGSQAEYIAVQLAAPEFGPRRL